MSSYVEIPAGQFVFREGDPGNEMYIIETGAIEILREVRGTAPLAILEPGDFFGEMAVLEDQPRFASARARDGARLLRIDRAAFAELVQQNFEIAVRIMRKLAMRSRRAEQSLQNTAQELADLKRRLTSPTTKGTLPAREPPPLAQVVSAPLMKLVHRESRAEYAVQASQREALVGRPDPVTGFIPEINLGALDAQRTLSRRHAKLLVEGSLVFVREEVGTTNGTFVNDERLKTGVPSPLKVGDAVRFGSIELDVQAIL